MDSYRGVTLSSVIAKALEFLILTAATTVGGQYSSCQPVSIPEEGVM